VIPTHVTKPRNLYAKSSAQGKYLPGSHVPVLAPSVLAERRPDVVLILPWNLADEVMTQQSRVAEWGARFVTAVPQLRIY